jgi:ABC-2 type transport system permease protein
VITVENESGRPAGRGNGSETQRVVAAQVGLGERLVDLWRSRELVVYLVRKELKVKYKNSILGFLWSMLNPTMYLGIYYLVFQVILRNGIPYFAIYLLCGLQVWNFFNSAVMSATTAVVGNAGLVKQVSFPRELLALASVGSALVFFGFQAVILVGALVIFGFVPAWNYLWLIPIGMFGLIVLASALAVLLSALNVYLRDIQHLMELALVAWFWGTPVVYGYEEIAQHLAPHHLTWLYLCNPVSYVVLIFQRSLYTRVSYHSGSALVRLLPSDGPMWYLGLCGILIAIGVVLFLFALWVFSRVEGNLAEEL